MSNSLVSVLHHEERSIVAELRASKPFQRLEAIRRLLALYDVQPSVAAGLDMPVTGEPDRAGGEVIHFATAPAPAPAPVYTPPPMAAPASAAAQPAPVASAIPLPGPAAAAAPAGATQVAAIAEAAVADVVMRSPATAASAQVVASGVETEASSVVSSVRAALLGIGKA